MPPTKSLADFVLEQSRDAISIVGPDYRYRYANPIYEQHTGMAAECITGSLVAEIMDPDTFATVAKPNLDLAFTGRTVNYQAWFNMPALGHRRMDVQYTPLRCEDGKIDSVVVIAKDITQWTQAEAAAIQAEQRLNMALKAAKGGAWQWDCRTNLCVWSAEVFRILGYEPGSVEASYENWLKAVHPEDRPTSDHNNRTSMATGEDAVKEYRV
ncbi:MAG: PAS domain-containing protein, partial [Magnetospirillum sp.]|nr:PAS domain-containing protein [Magnetospirillum sp.]